MIEISPDTYKQKEIETLFDHHERVRLNEKHIEEEMGYPALRVIASNKKQRQNLVDFHNYQPFRIFLKEKLAKTLIMDCRTAESCDLKKAKI